MNMVYGIPNWKCVSSMPSHDRNLYLLKFGTRNATVWQSAGRWWCWTRDERTNDSCNNCLSQLLFGWTSSASCKTVSVACAVGTRSETKQSSEKSEPNLEYFFSSFICETFARFHCVGFLPFAFDVDWMAWARRACERNEEKDKQINAKKRKTNNNHKIRDELRLEKKEKQRTRLLWRFLLCSLRQLAEQRVREKHSSKACEQFCFSISFARNRSKAESAESKTATHNARNEISETMSIERRRECERDLFLMSSKYHVFRMPRMCNRNLMHHQHTTLTNKKLRISFRILRR